MQTFQFNTRLHFEENVNKKNSIINLTKSYEKIKFKTYFLNKTQQLRTHKLIIFKQMHQHNNVYCGSKKAYWIDHKLVYFAFQLPYYISQGKR